MSQRAALLAYLRQAGLSTARAEANLDAFAHELAEQIREWTKEDGGAPEYGSVENVLDAADRIDPYANGAGPVRPDEEPTT